MNEKEQEMTNYARNASNSEDLSSMYMYEDFTNIKNLTKMEEPLQDFNDTNIDEYDEMNEHIGDLDNENGK